MANEAQKEYWNGEVGARWAERDDFMTRLLEPAAFALLEKISPESGIDAIDIGCGGGSQTITLAEKIGVGGSVLGVDISAPLLDCARERLIRQGLVRVRANVEFLKADASTHGFVAESADLLFSRFGVMFFDDPFAAFANLRQALRPNGNLGFCCWREKSENDWINLPYQAIRPCLPEQPEEDPFAPGPFAFARHEYVFEILGKAGFSGIQIIPCDVSLSFGPSKDIQAAVKELTLTGPLAKLMADLSDDVRAMAFDSVVTALEPHYQDGTVTLSGALWLVMAKK